MEASKIISAAMFRSLQLAHGYESMAIFMRQGDCPCECKQWRTKNECDDMEVKYRLPDCRHGERGSCPGDSAVAEWHNWKSQASWISLCEILKELPGVTPSYYSVEIDDAEEELVAELRALGARVVTIDRMAQVSVADPESKVA